MSHAGPPPAAPHDSAADDSTEAESRLLAQFGEHLRSTLGLSHTPRVERDVRLTLKPPVGIPLRPAVPEHDQLSCRHRRTSTPSSIRGQSCHSRSSA